MRESDLEGGPSTRRPPVTNVDEETISENTVEAEFPPPMEPRPQEQ
jgi:hypothetical protein